ncbi:hypothetical protein VF14_03655 [Nostoc linckia z18]|nr:hypothetical protein VF02_01125 [Nostoc linckia z1]PHJ85835.1 hypothetical protein VF06_06450 [Nostoc linckia z4]PHK12922.1 hypothetical protein VF09_00910 [Nostoc linckia z9]PHK23552.1 hypothetical protein VF11_00045 [Nostoc linckia z14]PHK24512.1 hypothetical protein VF10_11745 [Nostoc linckia z13]PHK37434.1 hypothetical protein VF14_03655 [Nostoc linckia z18]PHK41470.1 hypothetical protein VF12_06640 [Nostoc linckia z15]PHK46971.1 hypothetical protein VF13_08300 [Nostoc linckia z16]
MYLSKGFCVIIGSETRKRGVCSKHLWQIFLLKFWHQKLMLELYRMHYLVLADGSALVFQKVVCWQQATFWI